MAKLKVSIIIPTYGRSKYIGKAIESCLDSRFTEGQIEILICVNGVLPENLSDLDFWRQHPSIKILSTPVRGANLARNLGLKSAQGTFIKFLDDDDYIFGSVLEEQISCLEKMDDVDICSGSSIVIDENKVELKRYLQPLDIDFCEAVLSGKILALNFTHLYRRSSLEDVFWDEELDVCHDHVFLYRLLAQRTIKWHPINNTIGVWRWHKEGRQSSDENGLLVMKAHVDGIISAVNSVQARHRSTEKIYTAAAKGIWLNLHPIFYTNLSWSAKVARQALALNKSVRPNTGRAWLQPWIDHFPIFTEIVFGILRKIIHKLFKSNHNFF